MYKGGLAKTAAETGVIKQRQYLLGNPIELHLYEINK